MEKWKYSCSSFSSLIYKSSVWMGKGIPFKSYQWQLARKWQWCYTKKEYKVTDFQRQCYKSILILEVNFLTLWILAIIPRQAIFAMLKTWILTFLNNLWTMLQNLELCNISFHINTSKRFICRMDLWLWWLQFCIYGALQCNICTYPFIQKNRFAD